MSGQAKRSASPKSPPPDLTQAVERFDQWRRRVGRIQADALMRLMADAKLRAALFKTFAHADYLARCCLAHPDAAVEALLGEPSKVLADVARDLRSLDRATGPTSALASAVKPLKERAVVAIGLADLSEKWTHDKVGAALTDLAERILDAGLGWFTRLAYRHGEITAQEDQAPVPLPGLFILGGGSLAADEPSFCGPLELALVFDPKAFKKAGIGAQDRSFFRIAGELADAFGALNKDGTIFEIQHQGVAMAKETRTAKHAAFALSAVTMRKYLTDEADARDRAWFAKARVVAGDRKGGGEFIDELSRVLWRRGFDAAEIRSAVSDTEADGKASPLTSGRAHRRLVETCQLALGQQHDEFRHGSARAIFETAARIGALDELSAHRLASNYEFDGLARNRLQLKRGTAVLEPENGAEIEAQAVLCNYGDAKLFTAVLKGMAAESEQHWLNIVSEPTQATFDVLGGAPGDKAAQGEPRDVGRLEEIGFADGRDVSSIVDNWLKGRYSGAANEPKQRLSQLAPGLLTEFAATQNPDQAVANFDRLLTHLAEDAKPFERLHEEPKLADTVVDSLGNTSHLGKVLADNATLAREIFDGAATYVATAEEWLAKYPAPRRHGTEDQVFDALSAWLWENRARLCVAWLRRELDLDASGRIFAGLADAVVNQVYEICSERLGDKDAGAGLALLAMGQYGGGWLSVDQPLEIVFVYDPQAKDGASPDAVRQYVDLASAITEALTKPRALKGVGELPLFEVDLRRRPGGTAGEMASSIRVYLNHYVGQSDARDSLGLMRARVVASPARLKARIEEGIADVVTRPRQVNQLMRDIDRARTKELRFDRSQSIWEIDRIRGGTADLDLIVQCLQLKHGPEHPYVFTADASEALSALSRGGCIESTVASELIETLVYWRRIRAVQAFTQVYDPVAERPRKRLAKLIARAAGVSDFTSVEPLIRGHAERTSAHYAMLILGAQPEQAAPPAAQVN